MLHEREVISVGVRYTSPDGHTVHCRTHDECETAIRDMGIDPDACTVELTPITEQVNHWPGIRQTPRPDRCIWA